MKFFDLLLNAAGGGLLGIVGQLAVGWFEIKRADAESRRRIAEMEALSKIRVEEAAMRAFEASQSAGKPSGNEPGWAAAVLTLARPVLTLLLVGFAVYVYSSASGEVRSDMTGEITACAFGAVWWWFGSRYQARIKSR